MASVTSLDQDMKKLRLGRYTPQAANEARSWIEDILGERLPPGDLLDALKDGTVLCRLVNLAIPGPGVKFKKSPMPFIQMENISHFLRACENAPLNMPSHDRFLTVDLYESKDPAQVLQCLSAFSRVANSVNPSNFPTTIGPRRGGGPLSPAATGGVGASQGGGSLSSPGFGRSRGPSTTSNASGSNTFNPLARPQPERALSPHFTGGSNSSKTSNGIPKSPPGGVSSWSRKTDEGVTAPAWNIHQYGYMGGASQGNQGIAFGARRQITSAAPKVPSLAEKERKRREQEAEDERLRTLAEEAEQKRRVERQAEEERQWEEETRKQKEAKQRQLEKQKQEWEEQERQWKLEEELRQREEQEEQERVDKESRRKRAGSDARLRGQYLSQYQAEQVSTKPRSRRNSQYEPESNGEQDRIRELERQLEEAKERERQYQQEREERSERRRERARSKSRTRNRSQSRPRPQPPPRAPSPQDSTASWAQADDRDYLRKQWQDTQRQPPRPLPELTAAAPSTRPLPEPATSPRPLPDPAAYAKQSRTDRYLASNPPPVAPKPAKHIPPELTSTSERAAEDARRTASQTKTKAGGWASKSLLEREMERERERQQEWEDAQRALQSAPTDPNAGTGEGQSWDVNQYGYIGGDSQNKGGISFGGRRQILGPRPFGQR
ncbi:calponin [Paraconiothyrium brasiliense]|uniref:Calponin n=1 Tax=Paraconiothyrium brasiliense TaxID=300254 RepID=A0ABR3QQH9_9PLEO